MTTRFRRSAALALGGWVMFAAAMAPARAADRPADKILAEIRGVEMPQIASVDRGNRQSVQNFMTRRQAAMEKKAGLIGELYQQHPDTPELLQLMPERWQAMIASPKMAGQAGAEIDQVIASSKNEKLTTEAGFVKVLIAFQKAGREAKADDVQPAVDEFTKRFPKDQRGAEMLDLIAKMTPDATRKAALTTRLETEYPESAPARALIAERRQQEAIGKPFEIEFVDAIKGGRVNSASLKGKVVIIDYWATWCGPCVAEMPKMKSLYNQYKVKGVEFIGVSLDAPRDQGGYDKLKGFVATNEIDWPQYYEGKISASDFATSWGITTIPSVFAVGADGKLVTTDARGKLDELIPELLAQAGKGKSEPAKP